MSIHRKRRWVGRTTRRGGLRRQINGGLGPAPNFPFSFSQLTRR
jgi:hypothetical protein